MGVINRSGITRRRSMSRLGFLSAAASEASLEANATQLIAAKETAPAPTVVSTPTPAPVVVESAPPPPVSAVYTAPPPAPAPAVTLSPVATVEPTPTPTAVITTATAPAATPAQDALNAFITANPPTYMVQGDDYATVAVDAPNHPLHYQYVELLTAAEHEQGQAQYDAMPQFLKDFQLGLGTYGSHAVGEALSNGQIVVPPEYQAAASDMLAWQQAHDSTDAWNSWGQAAWLTAMAAITGGAVGPGLVAATGSTVYGGAATGAIVGTQSAAFTGGDLVKGAIIGAATGGAVGEAKDLLTGPMTIEPPPIEAVSPPPPITFPTSEQIVALQETAVTNAITPGEVLTAPPIESVIEAPLIVPPSAPVWVNAETSPVLTSAPDFTDTMPPATPEHEQPGAWQNVYGNTWHEVQALPGFIEAPTVVAPPPIESVTLAPFTSEEIIAAQESAVTMETTPGEQIPQVVITDAPPPGETSIIDMAPPWVQSEITQVVITDAPMMPPAVPETALAEQGLVETQPGVFVQPPLIDMAPPWVQSEIPQVVITDSPMMPPAVPETALAEQGLVETQPGVFEQIDNAPPWVQDEQAAQTLMPPAQPETSQSLQEQGLTETQPDVFEQTVPPPESFDTTPQDSGPTDNGTTQPPPGGGGDGTDPFTFDNLIKVGTKLLPGLLLRDHKSAPPLTRRPLPTPEYLTRPAPTQAGMSGNFWLFAGLGLVAVVLDAPKKRRRR